MIELGFDLVPKDGFNAPWLKEVYRRHITRSRAVGKDGIRPQAFERDLDAHCDLIVEKVGNGTYQPTNYREKLIARGSQRKPRQISIPTIRDRLALRGALEFIKAHVPQSHPRPPHVFIKEIKTQLAITREHSSFLRMDICDFYPSLRHDLLRNALENSSIPLSIISLIMKAVSTRTGSSAQSAPTIGVPQGLSISNALAAIYMIDFDKILANDIFYRRYVDDILVVDHSEKINTNYRELWAGLDAIGLTSHPMGTVDKTETKTIAEGIQYLGYEISPSEVSIRQSSLARMFTNISKVLTCFRYKRDHKRHMFRLNLKISGCIINNARRGWLMFFSQTDNVSQLSYLDSWLEREVKKFDIEHKSIKKFKKAYYEIRFNLKDSTYIPNFDNYELHQKKEIISILSRKSPEEVETMDVADIDYEFNRLIGKEVSELERDIVGAVS